MAVRMIGPQLSLERKEDNDEPIRRWGERRVVRPKEKTKEEREREKTGARQGKGKKGDEGKHQVPQLALDCCCYCVCTLLYPLCALSVEEEKMRIYRKIVGVLWSVRCGDGEMVTRMRATRIRTRTRFCHSGVVGSCDAPAVLSLCWDFFRRRLVRSSRCCRLLLLLSSSSSSSSVSPLLIALWFVLRRCCCRGMVALSLRGTACLPTRSRFLPANWKQPFLLLSAPASATLVSCPHASDQRHLRAGLAEANPQRARDG